MYESFVAAHDPRQAPIEFEAKYGPSNLAVRENFLRRHPFDNGDLWVRDEALEAWPRRDEADRVCRRRERGARACADMSD